MTPLHNLTIKKFHDELLKKEFSAFEITKGFFKEISERDSEIGAYLSLNEEDAFRQAKAVDASIADGKSIGVLAGVPLAIKDNMLIKGLPATAASKILENYVASYDAVVIQKLKTEQAVFLGKTNMDEFAMGSSTENSAFKITRNPHDLERVPGGSSGGSAAAVAANLALGALGSDTGGSIREPASFCGVVGLKPTYGAISRSGLIAMASSLDQIGPLTKTVGDAALLFNAIRGRDPLDATSSEPLVGENYENRLLYPDFEKIKGMTVGIPEEYFIDGLNKEVGNSIELAMKTVKSLGVKFKKISLPHTKYALSCYYIINYAEVSSNLARFDGIRYSRNAQTDADRTQTDAEINPHSSALSPRKSALLNIYMKQRGEGFGAEAKRRIILGTFVLSSGYYDAYYKKAQQIRRLIKNDFDKAFKNVDVILTPVTPELPFKIGEKTTDPLSMYLSDIFTITLNLAGLPGISIPVREKKEGLPVGFQLIGKPWHEPDILGLGLYYEKTTAPELY
ncbi:MAG: Asp-tRNA(Asn)/Glu-tRNA(Gln) amidotransferase subunit GatA [Candidatus Liptonbacteria bacterium]|nr:Asp-tRNA(Asn)/Glu-tRNA(Gln) amidotransferase subunit GatA [Candidatus Liptonbacteria bacterium]